MVAGCELRRNWWRSFGGEGRLHGLRPDAGEAQELDGPRLRLEGATTTLLDRKRLELEGEPIVDALGKEMLDYHPAAPGPLTDGPLTDEFRAGLLKKVLTTGDGFQANAAHGFQGLAGEGSWAGRGRRGTWRWAGRGQAAARLGSVWQTDAKRSGQTPARFRNSTAHVSA